MASVTTEGVLERLTLYCNAMQVALPPLEYDPEDPEELLFTAALQAWIRTEGISFRWVMSGEVMTPADLKYLDDVSRMPMAEQARLLAALKDYTSNGGDLARVLRRHGFGA
jgi:hypothetical protein